METVTIASSRSLDMSDLVALAISVVVVGVICWQIIAKTGLFRRGG